MEKKENKQIALEQAKKLIDEELTEKREACGKEIKEILDKYGLQMQVTQPQIVLI